MFTTLFISFSARSEIVCSPSAGPCGVFATQVDFGVSVGWLSWCCINCVHAPTANAATLQTAIGNMRLSFPGSDISLPHDWLIERCGHVPKIDHQNLAGRSFQEV